MKDVSRPFFFILPSIHFERVYFVPFSFYVDFFSELNGNKFVMKKGKKTEKKMVWKKIERRKSEKMLRGRGLVIFEVWEIAFKRGRDRWYSKKHWGWWDISLIKCLFQRMKIWAVLKSESISIYSGQIKIAKVKKRREAIPTKSHCWFTRLM